MFEIYNEDCLEGMKKIPDGSVDVIITDPPYLKKFIPLHADLGEAAARILKDGGSLLCMEGHAHLPEVIELLSKSLRWHWCIAYLLEGRNAPLYQKRITARWKPVVWFVKGKYTGKWVPDVAHSGAREKDYHPWQQSISGMTDLVEKFTNEGDTVLDCFMGSGTTGVACVNLNRNFIGYEIDEKYFSVANERITKAGADKEQRLF